MRDIDSPLNSEERYLYGINLRLNILIEMFSSFLDAYAEEKKVATSENTVEEIEEVIEELDEEEIDIDYNEFYKKDLMGLLDEEGIEYNVNMLKSELVELANKNL